MNNIEYFLKVIKENKHLMTKQEYTSLRGLVYVDYEGAKKGYRKILMKNKKIDVYRRN